jgi:hypothetical protein
MSRHAPAWRLLHIRCLALVGARRDFSSKRMSIRQGLVRRPD